MGVGGDQRITRYFTVGCTGAEPFTGIPPVRESKDWCFGYWPGRVDDQENAKCGCRVWSRGTIEAKKMKVYTDQIFHPIFFWLINRLEVDKIGPAG